MQPCGWAEGDEVGLEVDMQWMLHVKSSLQWTSCSHSCVAVSGIYIKYCNVAINNSSGVADVENKFQNASDDLDLSFSTCDLSIPRCETWLGLAPKDLNSCWFLSFIKKLWVWTTWGASICVLGTQLIPTLKTHVFTIQPKASMLLASAAHL